MIIPMAEPSQVPDDTARLEGFSDAIFGFAATLLVVSLEVPRDFATLAASLRGFVAFGLSFAVLVGIWTVHRAFFKRYKIADLTIVSLNTALLFVVLFYVYPLKFIARSFVARFIGAQYAGDMAPITLRDLQQMFAIYGAGWAAVFVFVGLMYFHVWRKRAALGLTDDDAQYARNYFGHYMVFAAVGVLSAITSLANVGVAFGVPGIMYGLMGPALSFYWKMRTKGRVAATPVPEAAD
jgi:uncharacterized membrane protein